MPLYRLREFPLSVILLSPTTVIFEWRSKSVATPVCISPYTLPQMRELLVPNFHARLMCQNILGE